METVQINDSKPRSWHRVLDHISEVRLEVGGADFAALLGEAARALSELLLDGRAAIFQSAAWRTLEVRSADRESLLVDWLNEILFRAETSGWVPLQVEVIEATDRSVRARARGVILAEPPCRIKAATHHALQLTDTPEGIRGEVIFDV